ncbi:MAG: type 2 lanthipeptide synthetase LanM family protein [Jatrophihabitans sp.]
MTTAERADLDRSFDCLTAPALQVMATELAANSSLGQPERAALLAGTAATLAEAVRRKVSRMLLLELNAARLNGSLSAPDSESRWDEFINRASDLAFWQSLAPHYPSLLPRLDRVIGNRCQAALEPARRFDTDRAVAASLTRRHGAELRSVRFGQGDSHRGGRTVALLELSGGTVVYKPRSLAIDRALAHLLDTVFAGEPCTSRISVPRVQDRGSWGWAEFTAHWRCESVAELERYYTGLGHWLAMAALLSATDLHAENLIACGPVPVVIDCETLFSPRAPAPASGYGAAVDRAAALLGHTVLSSGLLPGRGSALGWRGVDVSAAGALPGQQPLGQAPQIIDAGTDLARLGSGPLPPMQAANQPSDEPQLHRFWPRVVAGFDELTDRLHRLDAAGRLEEPLIRFADVEMRRVLRATEAYAELGRMLWHPVSLHDEAAAIQRASELLLKQAAASPSAPVDPAVVAAEVAELLDGDVPFFWTRPSIGRLEGPRGTSVGDRQDLVADALLRWRQAEHDVERQVIRSTLASAYLNDDSSRQVRPLAVAEPARTGSAGWQQVDRQRRQLAAAIVGRLVSTAIAGDDGTVTWAAPSLAVTGWSVQPLGADAYSGLPGVAVLLAGWLREAEAGRATPVDGVAETLRATLHTMRLAEARRQRDLDGRTEMRPEAPGRWVGLGSRIWSWLRLRELGAVGEEGLARATALADQLPAAVAATAEHDLLVGTSGAMVALLELAAAAGDPRWLALARSVAEQATAAARWDIAPDGSDIAMWPSPRGGSGIGGYAHGATGIGWALAKLAVATGDSEFERVAAAAFAFEETLWDGEQGGWLDIRGLDDVAVATAWCHGATGIGLASADLLRGRPPNADHHASVVRRAVESCLRGRLNWNHTLCHGDLGCWELLVAGTQLGLATGAPDPAELAERTVASIAQHGPIISAARDSFTPGLIAGTGGIAYQLLRLHPDCELGSVLVPG